MRYRKVAALGATLGSRIGAAEWVEDALPQTLFSEHEGPDAKAEAARGLRWVHGDEAAYAAAPVRDALSFTGGRWFRLFVGAASRETAR